jgi:hypothetical protein
LRDRIRHAWPEQENAEQNQKWDAIAILTVSPEWNMQLVLAETEILFIINI